MANGAFSTAWFVTLRALPTVEELNDPAINGI
jgi:hypothetical protein